jgi:hypothetical protein
VDRASFCHLDDSVLVTPMFANSPAHRVGACMIAGIRLARQNQVYVRVLTTIDAINESVELAHEIFNRIFRKVPEKMQ